MKASGMEKTFFFYDLETSGRHPQKDRIMQFAGQRTNLNLEPIGEPVNLLVKLPDDTLPSPAAISITRITPQSTQSGMTEAEFCKYVSKEIFTADTIIVGYNSIRFDDEFMRYCFWRNFYDPYEWQWKKDREKWDLLDVVRMTRALRPEGINWPVDENGKASNKLELLTKANGITHESAHDAMSDVNALIAVTKLIKNKQPDLFKYLFRMRSKWKVKDLVNPNNPSPFVYSSGHYKNEYNKTTVVYPITTTKMGTLVFDLRVNLKGYLSEKAAKVKEEGEDRNPGLFPIIKELRFNRCPAVAPLGVLERNGGWERIGLSKETMEDNLKCLLENKNLIFENINAAQENKDFTNAEQECESRLYDGFLNDRDRNACSKVRNATEYDLALFTPDFIDERLDDLFIHYKGRNFPETLSPSEKENYEAYRKKRILNQEEEFCKELTELTDESLIQKLNEWKDEISP